MHLKHVKHLISSAGRLSYDGHHWPKHVKDLFCYLNVFLHLIMFNPNFTTVTSCEPLHSTQGENFLNSEAIIGTSVTFVYGT
jgi:hypothetical protein